LSYCHFAYLHVRRARYTAGADCLNLADCNCLNKVQLWNVATDGSCFSGWDVQKLGTVGSAPVGNEFSCGDHHEEHHRERHLSLRIPAETAASVRQEASAATAESPRNIRR
jgi:hypothetical protein